VNAEPRGMPAITLKAPHSIRAAQFPFANWRESL
jgi:hypothetical protein